MESPMLEPSEEMAPVVVIIAVLPLLLSNVFPLMVAELVTVPTEASPRNPVTWKFLTAAREVSAEPRTAISRISLTCRL